MTIRRALFVVLACSITVTAQKRPAPAKTELAPGVVLFTTPSYGAPLHDKQLLHATMEVFRVLLREGKAAKARGLTADQAKDAIVPSLHDVMVTITSDAIAAIPPS